MTMKSNPENITPDMIADDAPFVAYIERRIATFRNPAPPEDVPTDAMMRDPGFDMRAHIDTELARRLRERLDDEERAIYGGQTWEERILYGDGRPVRFMPSVQAAPKPHRSMTFSRIPPLLSQAQREHFILGPNDFPVEATRHDDDAATTAD